MLGRLRAKFILAATLCGPLLPAAAAQSTLTDNSCVVVTSEGLFLVVNQDTHQVFDVTPFGELLGPSVTWIDGTNQFIVTTRASPLAPGGVFRVTLAPDGTGSVQDLTPTLPSWIEPDFSDADYVAGLDLLFLLQPSQGEIVVWSKPAQSTLAALAPWGTVPNDARSIAVNGSKQPFAVVAVLASGPVVRVDKFGTHELYATGGWNDVVGHPVAGDLIVSRQVGSTIGMIASASVLFDFNVSGFCGPIVAQPSDVEWDPIAGRAVAIAAEALQPCAFGGATTAENHIVRLPLTAGGGPASNVPVLLTPEGASGITGSRADLALVRHGGSEMTYWAWPSGGAGTSEPTFAHNGPVALGKTASLQLKKAPPNAAAILAIGLTPQPVVVQGQSFMRSPDVLLPAVTSASGAASFALKLPSNATPLVGFELYMQWAVDDTTTAAGGDIVSSQAAVFTVGLK